MTMYEKLDEIFAKMNKDDKMSENNFSKASLDELNEWKIVVEKVINRKYDKNNPHHVDITNKANRCLKRINEEIEKRKLAVKMEQSKKENSTEEKIKKLTEEVENLKARVDNFKSKLQSEIESLEKMNTLVQSFVEEYRNLQYRANNLFYSITGISMDITNITKLKESINSLKKDIVELKNDLIEFYNKKINEYNFEFNNLMITDEEKKKYNLPNSFTTIEMVSRYYTEGFYKKIDTSKLVEAISNLRKIKADRYIEKIISEKKLDKTLEKIPEKVPEIVPKKGSESVGEKTQEEKAKEEKRAIMKAKGKLLVKKVRSAAVKFYKKHKKFVLYLAGLASIAIAGLSVSSLIAPAILFGSAVFIKKEPKYEPAFVIVNDKLGNKTVSEEEVINNLNEATIKCAKTKGEALGLKGKIVSLGRKIKGGISKIGDKLKNNHAESEVSSGIHR